MVIRKMDFLWFVFHITVWEPSYTVQIITVVTRAVYMGFINHIFFLFLVISFQIGAILAIVFVQIIGQLNHWLSLSGTFHGCQKGKLKIQCGMKDLQPDRLLKIHICTKLLEKLWNEAMYYWFPFLMCSGGTILISSSYSTIKLHSVIRMPHYFGMPCISVVCVLLILALFPLTFQLHEQSKYFLKRTKELTFRNKYMIKKIQAQEVIRIKVGSFFHCKKSTITTYFKFIFESTIDTLMVS